MLPYKNRLTKRIDFERVYRQGIFFAFGDISFKVARNTENKTRIGFSVGIKFSKKAVDRNRIKRILREIIRKNLSRMRKNVDIVITIRKNKFGKINFSKTERDLMEAFKKGKIII